MPPNAKQIKALAGKMGSSMTTKNAVLKGGSKPFNVGDVLDSPRDKQIMMKAEAALKLPSLDARVRTLKSLAVEASGAGVSSTTKARLRDMINAANRGGIS